MELLPRLEAIFSPGEALEGPPHLYRVLGDLRAILVLHHLHPLILELLRLCFDILQKAAHPQVRAVQEVQQVILPLPLSITMVLVLLGDQVLDRNVALVLPRLGLLNPIDPLAHVVERCGSIAEDGLQVAADLHELDLGVLHHLRQAHLRLGELDVQLVQQVRLLCVQVLELGLETRDARLDCRHRCHAARTRMGQVGTLS